MRILIAEDDLVSRRLVEATLTRSGYDVVSAEDGTRAWELLNAADGAGGVSGAGGFQLAVLDWMMPGLDGVEVCRRLRQRSGTAYIYVILLTARGQKEDVVAGLEAGADDYVTKPFDAQELQSRIRVGERIVKLESGLEQKVRELEDALAHVKRLQGLLPICMHCKKIRDDNATWHNLETYFQEHSEVMFTHGVCAECRATHYPHIAARGARSS